MNNYSSILAKINSLKFKKEESTEKRDETYLKLFNKPLMNKNGEYDIKVRFLPDFKAAEDSTINPIQYFSHEWESRADGRFVHVRCLGKGCPICKTSYEMYKAGNKDSKPIGRRESHFINVYVIDNPADPTQNGKVKVLRMKESIHKGFELYTTGRHAKLGGVKLFDLTKDGVTFVIHVEKKTEDFPNYFPEIGSGEDNAEDVANLTGEDITRIYEQAYALSTLFPEPMSVADATAFLDKEYLNPSNDGGEDADSVDKDVSSAVEEKVASVKPVVETSTIGITRVTETPVKQSVASADNESTGHSKLDDLLAGL